MNKGVFTTQEDINKVVSAMQDILDGKCSKVIVNDNIKVYKCTNVIRVDFKCPKITNG